MREAAISTAVAAPREAVFDEAVPTASAAVAEPAAHRRSRGPARRPAPRATDVDPAPTRETHTGRLRRIRAQRPAVEDLVPPQPDHSSAFRRRYGIHYDTQGWKCTMGFLWAVAVAGALWPQALRPWGLAVLYGVVAAAAAAQVVDAARGDHDGLDRVVAGLGASGLAVAATLGAEAIGVGYLALVAVSVVATVAVPEPGRLPIARAGSIVLAAGLTGGAAASLVLLAEYEIGALIILLVFVMAYDASDFAVGSGASSAVEGPLAGMLMMAPIALGFALLKVPPFRGADITTFAVLAMVAFPAGQILASSLLPKANHHAPALRRIDTLLIAAPAWAGLVGLYLSNSV